VPLIALFPLPLFLPPSFFIFLSRSLSFSPSFSLPLTLALDLGLAHSPSRSPLRPLKRVVNQPALPRPPAPPCSSRSHSLLPAHPNWVVCCTHTCPLPCPSPLDPSTFIAPPPALRSAPIALIQPVDSTARRRRRRRRRQEWCVANPTSSYCNPQPDDPTCRGGHPTPPPLPPSILPSAKPSPPPFRASLLPPLLPAFLPPSSLTGFGTEPAAAAAARRQLRRAVAAHEVGDDRRPVPRGGDRVRLHLPQAMRLHWR
jgi:hypothetical protein